ncbi:hypothetical protein BS50DRAFT_63163 [Corynespora cassiicola Philippines]|uniref:Ubiquitin-like-conjugating enzyme ATG10 n=1 Tax=Corynespora cassiicola Philippines TaxID=1448308 RepID=A0A2T2NJL0_CORCC|nr:hypothetical protein BS50DRAFT_63163 [Corynespora cassiicola Philippines]
MTSISDFPHLTTAEFQSACAPLHHAFSRTGDRQTAWISVELVEGYIPYLRITKPLNTPLTNDADAEDADLDFIDDDDDEEALRPPTPASRVSIVYDIILSPGYGVPVLYFHIQDPQFRFPPTMDTLYAHIMPAQFKTQAMNVGVMGGVTVTEHPALGKPVYFIHPCQTADLMREIVGETVITAEDYLVMWIGALGKCVGLDVPLEIAKVTAGERP